MARTRRTKDRVSIRGSTPCLRCPLRQRAAFRSFTAAELEFVEWFKTAELTADQGSNILLEGHNSPHLYTLLEGWAFRYKTLPDGRRQILSFALPGDFLGIQGPVLKEMQHSVEAASRVVLCVFPRERLWKLYQKHPDLAHDLVWLATRGEHMADDHLISVGRRTATERIAFLVLHLFNRCKTLGMTTANRLRVPISQRHVSDALGLSLVHTNKTLRRLQRQNLLTWNGNEIELKNEKSLREIAQYDEDDNAVRPLI